MLFRLTTTASIHDEVRRLLHDLLAESIASLTNPGEGEQFDISIHSARKNGKRLRAVLRLARPLLSPETFQLENDCYRDTSRQLAPLRDNWVMVETIDKLGDNWPAIRAQLVANYERERENFVADWVGLGNVTTVLQAAQARISQLPLVAVEEAWLFEGVRRTYRAGQRLMSAAYLTADPHLFHEWRKQVKYLWHQHELLHEVWPALMGEAAEAFHILSSLLGDAHDLVVLEQTVTLLAASLPADELLDLVRHLRQRQGELETAARPLGQRLFAETPRAFAQRLAAYWHLWQTEARGELPALPLPSFASTAQEEAQTPQDDNQQPE